MESGSWIDAPAEEAPRAELDGGPRQYDRCMETQKAVDRDPATSGQSANSPTKPRDVEPLLASGMAQPTIRSSMSSAGTPFFSSAPG